jgi:ABC-type tungstate transport system substrate-binding protein
MGSPIALSFEVACVATLLSTGLSLVLARLRLHREGAGWLLLDAVLSSPLVLPPTVLGYLLLVVLGQRSPLGAFWERLTGHGLVFNLEGAVIAATLTSFPLVYQGTRAALAEGISIAPGPIFSPTRQFADCMRLNFGQPWTARTEAAIATLGRMVGAMAAGGVAMQARAGYRGDAAAQGKTPAGV